MGDLRYPKEEYIDGLPRYWVKWIATLVSESDIRKLKTLLARFEASQRKQKGGKGRGRLLLLKAGTRVS
jgi:hypothetical protein